MSKIKFSHIARNIISFLTAFILSVFLALIAIICSTNFGLLNDAIILDSMNKSSYYEAVNEYTKQQAKDLAIPLGIPDVVFDDILSLQDTYIEGKAVLSAYLKGENYTINTDNLHSKLVNSIHDNLHISTSHTDALQEDNINSFANQVCKIYAQNLTVPYMEYFRGLKDMFSWVLYIGIPSLFVLSILAAFILIKIQGWLHRGLRYISYALISSALMTCVLPGLLLISKRYQKFNISPAYFNRLFSEFIGQGLMMYMYFGVLLICIAIVLITWTYYLRKKLLK